METTHKLQIAISALILITATVSLFFGPGLVTRFSSGQMQQSPTISVSSAVAGPVNMTEKDMIVGIWTKNPDKDPDLDKAEADLVENWTFYPDGTFAETHATADKDAPPIYDHGTWSYLGNTSYFISMDGLQQHIIRNGNILMNVDDQCTFSRVSF